MSTAVEEQQETTTPAEALVQPTLEEELSQLEEMTAYLTRARKGTRVGDKLASLPKGAVDARVAKKLRSAMQRLLGPSTLREQRSCGTEIRHERARICEECGYSDNLYLQELERILRRLRPKES